MIDVPFMRIDLTVAQPVEVSPGRRCIPITGGTVSGAYSGTVMAGGADWQHIGADGTIDIDAHYVLDFEQGRVEVESRGLRAGPADILSKLARGEIVDPSLYYFRTAIRFRTAAPALGRLNQMLAISRGERLPAGVGLELFEVK